MPESRLASRAAEAYFAAINAGDAAAFLGLVAPDVRIEDPLGTPVLSGPQGAERFWKGLRRAWAVLEMRAERSYARQDAVAVAWRAAGRSASGKDIAFEGIDTITVNSDGLIARIDGYWDLEAVIAQM